MRIQVSQEVPTAIKESVHGISFSASTTITFRTLSIDKRFGSSQRIALSEFYIFRKQNRQIFLRNRDDAAFTAVNNRYGSAPVSLTGDEPVAKLELCSSFSGFFGIEEFSYVSFSFFRSQACKFSGVD